MLKKAIKYAHMFRLHQKATKVTHTHTRTRIKISCCACEFPGDKTASEKLYLANGRESLLAELSEVYFLLENFLTPR